MNNDLRIYYGEYASTKIEGPVVRLQRMNAYFPNCHERYNLMYTTAGIVSHIEVERAKRAGIPVVLHMNNFYHRAYRGERYREMNSDIEQFYTVADGIVFGSEHVRQAAYTFFGKRDVANRIIYNAVDVEVFRPHPSAHHGMTILCIGNHYVRHRIEPLMRVMPALKHELGKVTLWIVGPLHHGTGIFDCSHHDLIALAKKLGVARDIKWKHAYSPDEAPAIYNASDVVVHCMHMDWTPYTLIEAMACGVPVVHAGNGGLPELVGDAGLSLDMPTDWDTVHEPDDAVLIERIKEALEHKKRLGHCGRQRALERYAIERWVAEHRAFFNDIHMKSLERDNDR